MDFHYPTDAKRGSTINPADLHNGLFTSSYLDGFCGPADTPQLTDLSTVDSAVDLTSLQQEWSPPVKLEEYDPAPLDQFFDIGETSAVSSTPSPAQDMIFSNANSPGDFIRDHSHSQTGSPETTNDFLAQTVKQQPMDDDKWKLFATPEAIHIPQTLEKSHVYLIPDKTKTRAETQIKVQLILDPVDDRFEYIRFPRKTLAKPKLLASVDEQKDIESRGDAISMELFLVCATAIEKPERHQQALRRARGEEKIPRRPTGVAISEIDKEDPSHPQNGGEVLICEGCKERERKRYDRKKKRAEDEAEWWDYEDDRIIMINEKEYKKWKDVQGDQMYSSRAKQIEFAMRIACYCRHQEEKSPVGYRVVFTFKDGAGNLVAQHTSEIFQITDDHKNKEIAPEALPRPLTIPQPYVQTQYAPHPNTVPIFTGYSMDGQYPQPGMAAYSQPQTPVMSNFQSPMSPVENQFPQTTPNGLPIRQQHPNYSAPSHSQPPSFTRASNQPHYDAPMLSPTAQVTPDNTYLPRPVSMDNFNFSANMQYASHNGFQSAPPSAVSTPINLSRPASPSWDQGPRNKKMMCVYFYVDDE